MLALVNAIFSGSVKLLKHEKKKNAIHTNMSTPLLRFVMTFSNF